MVHDTPLAVLQEVNVIKMLLLTLVRGGHKLCRYNQWLLNNFNIDHVHI